VDAARSPEAGIVLLRIGKRAEGVAESLEPEGSLETRRGFERAVDARVDDDRDVRGGGAERVLSARMRSSP
jgi:hypothetical protein